MSLRTKHYASRTAALLIASLLLANAGTAWAATAAAPMPAEEGWPQSHFPQSDPAPGDAGYAEPQTSARPADGMTDAQLRAKDPAGYRALLADRAQVESALLSKVRARLKTAGIAVGAGRTLSPADLKRATATIDSTPWSPYGYLKFRLVPSSSTYARNGYLGTLYFTYGIYSAVTDSYKWYTVSWPARSGNNRPADQDVIGVGPIPEYKWTFGYMYGTWYGYQTDVREEFSPGKWRLDPWTGAPYGRSYLEVHGGINEHEFGATSGCIRLHSKNIPSLKSYYDYKMANKKDSSTAKLTVDY